MEKLLKCFVAISLSLMLMFTMGLNVFAAEGVEGTPTDNPAVTLDEGDAVVTDSEAAVADEEEPAEEVQAMDAEPVRDGEPTIDSVRTAIQGLSADPSSFTPADKENVEGIWEDFQALSAENQATLDAECTHSGTGQPLGRVLESALWAVWSYNEVDDTTTLPDGIYDKSSNPALNSSYSKGKSTSGRQKPWSVKKVTVTDGHATAVVAVESNTYQSIWIGGKDYQEATYPDGWNNGKRTSGNCEFEGVPIDLNSTFYIAGNSTSMSTPIAFSITTDINEPASYTLDVENSVSMFNPGKTAIYAVAGDPNTSNYSRTLTLNMGSGSMTKVKNGDSREIELGEGNVFADIPIVPGAIQKLQFYSKKNKDWYNRFALVDLNAKKLYFTDFKHAEIEPLNTVTYTGKAITPKVVVKVTIDNRDYPLTEEADYTVGYTDNVNAGTATVTATGTDPSADVQTATFTIKKANQSMTVKTATKTLKVKKLKKKAQTVAPITVKKQGGAVTYSGVGTNKKAKKALSINAKTGKITVKKKTKKGTYKMKVTVKAAANNNYNAASKTVTVTIKIKK